QALLGGLLSGLEVEELRKLQWADVDLETGAIRTGNTHQRTVTLSNEVRQLFQNHADHKSEPGVFVWDSSNQEPYSTAAIDALVNSAAHQAGVPAAEDIGAETLRSTYIAFLARQGVRRDLLEQTVGRLSQPMQDSIQMLSPPGANEDLQTIQRVYPALRAKAGSPGS
ncbi:MAG: tyrosine-type recombinase/integrase, partial [Planctomycetales bacterium]|nr:tyrosine-type recombinase/integrase [Planctomycetales bacterium]